MDDEEAKETVIRENDALAAALSPMGVNSKEIWISGHEDFLGYLREIRPELQSKAGRDIFPECDKRVKTAVTWHEHVMRPACLRYMRLKSEYA